MSKNTYGTPSTSPSSSVSPSLAPEDISIKEGLYVCKKDCTYFSTIGKTNPIIRAFKKGKVYQIKLKINEIAAFNTWFKHFYEYEIYEVIAGNEPNRRIMSISPYFVEENFRMFC